MDIDMPTEAGPTEETVGALMEHLVGPLLPLKHTGIAKETPSELKQKTVAKQVHAAVVLYNYYHLSHHRENQFLKFDQFCKLAMLFRPSIVEHMKYMCQSDHTVLNEPENQLSRTEKAIMDACTISETLLNASDDISNVIKEWKITKVAVFLIDSKKENCFLQFNNGVWSLIERELKTESKKRKKIMTEYGEEGEVGFQKCAFSTVKEVTGIGYGKLKILESHLVYSLSEAKTATRFYIMQSTQAISEDNLVPIQDVISSLQGPVVKKCLGSWVITPVVEYYYLLPYAEIISKLFSRESNSLPHQVKKGNANVNIIQGSQNSCEKESGERMEVSDNLHKKSKLDSEIVQIKNSSKGEPHDSKVTNNTNKSNQCSEKESGESKNVSDNLQKRSKLDSEVVDISNSSKEEPHDSKVGENTYNPNQCSDIESEESKKESHNLQKKSKLDPETGHISNSSTEESHDRKHNQFSEKESSESKEVSDNLQKKSKLDSETVHISNSSTEEPQDRKVSENIFKSNQCSHKESGESKKESDNLQKKSKLDSEIMHISNSSKEEPHGSKVSSIANIPNQCSEKKVGESKKVSDNLHKKTKLLSEIMHTSNSSKEEPHDSKVSKNTDKANKCCSTLEPVSKVADDVITFIGSPVDQIVKETESSTGKSITVSDSDSKKQEDMNGSCRAELNNSSSGTNNTLAVDKLSVCLEKENQNSKFQAPLKVYRHKKRSTPTKSTYNKECLKDLKKTSIISQSKDERVDGECMVPSNENRSLTVNHIPEDFNSIVDAKRVELSDAALQALLNKRQKLYDQQVAEGELTLCDKKIYAIMHGGVGDCLGLKLEAVIECCNEICKQDDMQTQQHTNLHVSRSSPLLPGKSLSEAHLTLRKACQELDDICLLNNWMLPTYCTSRSDGGFVANVTVKGTNFECSGVSGDQPSIGEARNSAASKVITRLQQMANEINTATLV